MAQSVSQNRIIELRDNSSLEMEIKLTEKLGTYKTSDRVKFPRCIISEYLAITELSLGNFIKT
jgi:hypothetical protein